MRFSTLVAAVLVVHAAFAESVQAPAPDMPFMQEYHDPYPIGAGEKENDVRAILATPDDMVYAATAAGVYYLDGNSWKLVQGVTDGATYDLMRDEEGKVWAGAWDGVYEIHGATASKERRFDAPVAAMGPELNGFVAMGPSGSWRYTNGMWRPMHDTWSREINAIAFAGDSLWIGTGMGLYNLRTEGLRHYYKSDEVTSGIVSALEVGPDGRLWVGTWGGLDVFDNQTRVASYTTADGLPHYDIRSLTFGPDRRLWVGTALGVTRFDGGSWSLRHSRRWLLSDDVRDVAIGPDGTAWIATGKGVSAIRRKSMTMREKADHYQAILEKRHIRPPGLVEKCTFPDPSNREVWEPMDDDNDGQYTSMYLVAEAFRYAVTEDPDAKRLADMAYDALEFLQTVTETDGFVARTVVPSDWTEMADANRTYTAQERAERRVDDPRYKPVEDRWRPSADGTWLWKGDTSSDEITGHYCAYYFYYDLVADDTRKERVRRHVARITDYIIKHNFVLADIDGKATRWGVWAPDKLLKDPDWRVEAPINAFEILSYLNVAHHITGDDKYRREYEKLAKKHGYADLARHPKSYGISERTHIDDELLALSGPGLILTESDSELQATYREGFTWAYRTVEDEMNPYFNFTAGMLGVKDFHRDDSVEFLRDAPLDLVMWEVDNSKREDLTFVRRPMMEPLQTSRMLPPSERGIMRWDKNPWEVISGDYGDPEGHRESSGVFWLLPYWMGRFCGFIAAP